MEGRSMAAVVGIGVGTFNNIEQNQNTQELAHGFQGIVLPSF
jgi:hypothetical protein